VWDDSGELRFEWDPAKARTNAAKHGVTFDEAASAFRNPSGQFMPDTDHSSKEEDRWVVLGHSERLRLLVVVHVQIESTVVRLISARRATQSETARYFHQIG
jgi:uncharacterized DUF497 family protein